MSRQASYIAQSCGLTTREHDILEQLLLGNSRQKVSDILGISTNTVNSHTQNIYQKMGIHSRQELIDYAFSIEDFQL